MKTIIKLLLTLLFLFMFAFPFGCSTTRYVDRVETKIKIDTLRIIPPEISAILQAYEDSLSIYGAQIDSISGDTVISVRYVPIERKIYVKAVPDTVFTTVLDTIVVNHTTEIIKEKGWLEKNAWYIALIVFSLTGLLITVKKVFGI